MHVRPTNRAHFWTFKGCLWAIGVILCACQGTTKVSSSPHHYKDKHAALASFEDPSRDEWSMPDRVVSALNIGNPNTVIADIGAGSGYFSHRLASIVPDGKVIAVDVDSDFKRFIEEHRDAWGTPNIEARLAVYENPLLPENSLDWVFVSNTYSFLNDRVGYFTEIRRALRTPGKLAVIDFRPSAICNPSHNCPEPAKRIGKSTVIQELEQSGFVVLREETFLPYQYFLILEKRQ